MNVVSCSPVSSPVARARADLFRLLGDEDRLRLLALCEADELTVGELAALLDESQPQITRKSQPLRDAGLLQARRDGTRTLLHADAPEDPIVAAGLEAGRALCLAEGRLARVPLVVAEREETARRLFGEGKSDGDWELEPGPRGRHLLGTPPAATSPDGATSGRDLGPLVVEWQRSCLPLLAVLAPLLPRHALAVDMGTGEGTLLPLLSPIYDRVMAVDRSPARLARAAVRTASLGLGNVRLRQAEVDDANLAQEIARAGGADLVVLARVLHHAARPQSLVTSAARLLRPGGHLALVDHTPHEDEGLRERGHVWLGFEPSKLRQFLEAAGLEPIALSSLRVDETPPLHLAVGRHPGDRPRP
jgi:SAM-dependent methyltransferase/DNA-binding transcriptional ArsR family regulator